jgi:hypothetical protein
MPDTAVVALARGYKNVSGYAALVDRTKSILKLPWYNAVDHDMVILHEGNVPPAHQEFIMRRSSAPHTKFLDIGPAFTKPTHFTEWAAAHCEPTELSERFPHGYKSMCAFWFSLFPEILGKYRSILRVDEDCLVHILEDPFVYRRCPLATVTTDTDEPGVTRGMDAFFADAAEELGLSWEGMSTSHPSTQVMWVDLEWARRSPIVRHIREKVFQTGCFYRNRWGDLSLWGCTLQLAGAQLGSLSGRYFHGSHGKNMSSKPRPGILPVWLISFACLVVVGLLLGGASRRTLELP